jgi:hypothetical protein
MSLSRNKLYLIILIACVAGYVWLAMNWLYPPIHHSKETSICLLKHFTNIPCPSCGSTRSLLSILNGNFIEGFYLNPLGYLLLAIMIIAPIWVVYDLMRQSQTLMTFYKQTEIFLSRKKIAIPAIALVLLNWAWNIYKGI